MKDDLREAMLDIHADSITYWSSFTTAAFLAPIGDAWSPAYNVRHLTKSIRAVTRGLGMPRLGLRAMFGKGDGPSRSYAEVRAAYRAELAKGATAGPFSPSEREAPGDVEAERARIMHEHDVAVRELCEAIGKWSDDAQEHYRMPHPLLGPIPVREMLLFTLYHNQHHVDNVRRLLVANAPH